MVQTCGAVGLSVRLNKSLKHELAQSSWEATKLAVGFQLKKRTDTWFASARVPLFAAVTDGAEPKAKGAGS